jgi:MFS family permease
MVQKFSQPVALEPDMPALTSRATFDATIGNMLEFYDFITYSYFAIQIGRTFFPSHSEFASLMLSLATFGAGFITRPIGALAIGAYSDRVGRRPAMILSFAMMGSAIIALALTPSYNIGVISSPSLPRLCHGGEALRKNAKQLIRGRNAKLSAQGPIVGKTNQYDGAALMLLLCNIGNNSHFSIKLGTRI